MSMNASALSCPVAVLYYINLDAKTDSLLGYNRSGNKSRTGSYFTVTLNFFTAFPLVNFNVILPFFLPLIVNFPFLKVTFANPPSLIPEPEGLTETVNFAVFLLFTAALPAAFFPFFILMEGFFTVTRTVWEIPFAFAVMTAVPFFTARITPFDTDATLVLEDTHSTDLELPVTSARTVVLFFFFPVYKTAFDASIRLCLYLWQSVYIGIGIQYILPLARREFIVKVILAVIVITPQYNGVIWQPHHITAIEQSKTAATHKMLPAHFLLLMGLRVIRHDAKRTNSCSGWISV